MLATRITEMFGIRMPVIQGGLAHLADARLAAAVSNAGGLGQVTAANFPTVGELKGELRGLKGLTELPVALNVPIGHWPWEEYLIAGLEEGVVQAVTVSGGNPERAFRLAEGARGPAGAVRRLTLVAGVRQAVKAEALGADAVIAVGQEAGGHIGRDDIGTFVLVRAVTQAVKVPVVAAGGFADGYGLVAALALGAEGILMGTRFVATAECRAHRNYKEAILRCGTDGTTVVERNTGRPGRALTSSAISRINEVGANVKAALEGDLENGFVWAGQSAGLIHDVPSVKELFTRFEREVAEALGRLSGTRPPVRKGGSFPDPQGSGQAGPRPQP